MGMDDTLVATLAVIDWTKHKLALAPATVTLAGDAAAGWTMHVGQGAAVFPFLKKYKDRKVYVAVSYMMRSGAGRRFRPPAQIAHTGRARLRTLYPVQASGPAR